MIETELELQRQLKRIADALEGILELLKARVR